MILIKNSQITEDMIRVLNSFIELDINASPAFKLSRIVKELSSIIEDKIKTEKRIFNKYVIRDENGEVERSKDEMGNIIPGTVVISDVDGFNKEMSELMNIEIELNHNKIKFDDLGLQIAKIKDLIKIEFLFE